MPIIQCGECEREISNAAKACPGCGAPVPTLSGSMLQLGCGLMGIGIALPIAFLILMGIYVAIFN